MMSSNKSTAKKLLLTTMTAASLAAPAAGMVSTAQAAEKVSVSESSLTVDHLGRPALSGKAVIAESDSALDSIFDIFSGGLCANGRCLQQ